MRHPTRLIAAAVAALMLPALGACGGSSDNSASGGDSFKIGLLLPETTTARYETKDKPYFESKLKEICPDCKLLYANANSKASTQQEQAQSMLTQKVDVLVVDPIDGVAAASIVNAAKQRDVPVVAYDRLIHSPDLAYVISNDYLKVGELQGQALVDKMKADGTTPADGGIIMMNGDKADNNALNIQKGALSVIDKSGFKVLSQIQTWDPAEAQKWAAGQITKFGSKIVGVYSANDTNAGGAIASYKAVGKPIPPMTGLDASVAGLQAIIAGDQYMTTYNAFQKEAETAAEVAYEFAQGKSPKGEATIDGHPASLNPPQAITADNIQSTVIADGFYKASELCTAQYAAACQKLGIK